MYETLEISGFRGIKHAKFDDLGQINVLVGRNNSGKTAFLEAAYLLSAGRTGFVDALGDNAMRKVAAETRPDAGWDYLIKQKSTAAVVTGSLAGSRQERLSIAKTADELRPRPPPDLVSKVVLSTNDKLKQFKGRMDVDLFFYFSGGGDVLGELCRVGSQIGASTAGTESDAGAVPPGLFVAGLRDLEYRLYDKVRKTGRIRDVIEWAKTGVPRIDGIRDDSGRLHVIRESDDPAPPETMGDGFRLSLALMLAAHSAKGGTLAIGEPENYLHPGLALRVVNGLVPRCIADGTQVFFSTHSAEFLQYVLHWAPPGAKVSVFRVNNLDGDTIVERYDRESATELVGAVGVDLRGL